MKIGIGQKFPGERATSVSTTFRVPWNTTYRFSFPMSLRSGANYDISQFVAGFFTNTEEHGVCGWVFSGRRRLMVGNQLRAGL
jgi:hypothetical protein